MDNVKILLLRKKKVRWGLGGLIQRYSWLFMS